MQREMEAEREPQQQEHPSHPPLQCPRCGSLETKFRYYNNHSLTQPRYCCKACKKLWTVGGKIRLIPNGSRTKIQRPSKASTSRGNDPIPQPAHLWLSLTEEYQHNSPLPTSVTTMVDTHQQWLISHPQHPWLSLAEKHQHTSPSPTLATKMVDTTTSQQVTSSPLAPPEFEPYYFNDEISCLDVIQSLIQPENSNQEVNAGNYFIDAGINAILSQERNVQNMTPQHTIHHGIPTNRESYQPNWPMNSLSHNITTGSSFTTSDAGLWSNFNGDPTNTEDTPSVNVDEWLNIPEDDPP